MGKGVNALCMNYLPSLRSFPKPGPGLSLVSWRVDLMMGLDRGGEVRHLYCICRIVRLPVVFAEEGGVTGRGVGT